MKHVLLFLLFSIFSTAQSLDATFATDGVLPKYDNTINSSQTIYDEADQNNIQYRVGAVIRNSYVKGVIAGYNTSGIFMVKEIGPYALQAVCFQADDKVITAGRNIIYRILSDNNFDTTFNTTGNQTINFGTYPMNIKCISTQTDGKIVVSGYVSNGTNNDFAIARLNTDGSFDTTFDSDGMQSIAVGIGNEQAFSHKIQSDGKIVVVGESIISNYDFAIIRLNTNGSLDTTFSGTGKKTIDFSSGIDRGRTLEILPDGRIVVFGQVAGAFGCMKLNSNGTFDSSFGSLGKSIFADLLSMSTAILSTTVHLIPKIKVLPDGTMILNGTSNSDIKFIKLLANGQLDTTYGTNGVVVVTNDIDNASSFRLNIAGEINFTAYTTSATSNNNFKILKGFISDNGLIVNSSFDFIYRENYFKDFKVLADGSYLTLIGIPYLNQFKMTKYLPNGSIDNTFGINGIVNMTSFEIGGEFYINVFFDKIYVSINTEIYKFNSDGTPDVTFDSDGKIDIESILSGFNSSYVLHYIDDFKIDNNGDLFIALEIGINNPAYNVSMGILKLTNNGTVNTTFGNNGLFSTRFNSNLNYYEYPRRILFQNDSKLKIVGLSINKTNSNDVNFCAFRLTNNGNLDTSFGLGGKIMQTLLNINNWPDNSYILPDNSIICIMGFHPDVKSIKFLADGSIDLLHGTNGVTNDVVGASNLTMTFQSDGKILKAGKKNEQFSISRYNADGSIDTTFGINGEVNVVSLGIDVDWGFKESSFSKIILQPDGKIIAGGNSFDGYYQVATLVRLTNSVLGTLDFSSTKNALSIYPNPIENAAIFEFSLANSESITIELYDVQGKLVQNIATNKEMASGGHNLPIELNQKLTSGNYFLKLSTPKGSQSIQIIKK